MDDQPRVSFDDFTRIVADTNRDEPAGDVAPGERPTLRDLSKHLLFSPRDGRIWLDQQRMVLLHANSVGTLRRELIERLGLPAARTLLSRVGYVSGIRDAELVRKRWSSNADAGAFTAGARLHALEGMVRATALSMTVDFARGLYRGDYLWHDSYEASEHIGAYGIGTEPACWMQLGYAAGYASAFLEKRVVYREVECMAMGAAACRVIGQTEGEWDDLATDPQGGIAESCAFPGNPRPSTHYSVPSAAGIPLASVASHVNELRPRGDNLGLVGTSAAFSAARHLVERVAPTPATVLFTGESGVGKELFARALHRSSLRAGKPFIAVNCAAIPDSLIESELFGVDKGAYTGATISRAGRFERASGGTLFLDEVLSLSLIAQGKLLRVLQEHEIDRVGSTRPVKVDVRIVVAANRELRDEVSAGRFREDLYYRLNVFPIHVPPLRQRRDDIPLLIQHFLTMYNGLYKKNVVGLEQRALETLLNYDYPGNVRELQNIIERGVITAADGGSIDVGYLSNPNGYPTDRVSFAGPDGASSTEARETAGQGSGNSPPPDPPDIVEHLLGHQSFSFVEHEKAIYQRALSRNAGNISAAARLLGITRAQLSYRMKSLQISGEE